MKWAEAHKDWNSEECLVWPFTRAQLTGYARMGREYVHRWMCERRNGPPPSPYHEAAHSCGNGHQGCVHPHHVSWKTPKENCDDRIAHGTSPVGEKNPKAKLSVSDVLAIKKCQVETRREFAERFNVSVSQIDRIRKGKAWEMCNG